MFAYTHTHIRSAQAFALLRLGEQYARLRDYIDSYMEAHIQANRAKEDLVLVSADFILSLSGMLFAVSSVGQGLLRAGHSLRELVERERGNYYQL